MIRDLVGSFVHSAGLSPLDRLCNLQVQPLAAGQGKAGEQRLPHQLVVMPLVSFRRTTRPL
jgi:hypothetical protein